MHEAVLAQSPVFRAMTSLPFKEREERTIRLLEHEASHIRCMVAFLYTGRFNTPSEAHFELPSFEGEESSDSDVGPSSSVPSNEGSSRPRNDPLRKSERALAADLAQIWVLGDKYELPRLQRRALQKLGSLFRPAKYPVRFLHVVVAVLNLYIPESNETFRYFVQYHLGRAAARAKGKNNQLIESIIENGFVRQGGVLAEEIMTAFAHDPPLPEEASDNETDSDSSSDFLPQDSNLIPPQIRAAQQARRRRR